MNEYRDENGHWTSKENDGGKCNHEGFDENNEDDFKLGKQENDISFSDRGNLKINGVALPISKEKYEENKADIENLYGNKKPNIELLNKLSSKVENGKYDNSLLKAYSKINGYDSLNWNEGDIYVSIGKDYEDGKYKAKYQDSRFNSFDNLEDAKQSEAKIKEREEAQEREIEEQGKRIAKLSFDDVEKKLNDLENYSNASKSEAKGGYSGQSKSNRALRAESDNQFPLSKWGKKKIQDLFDDGAIEFSDDEDTNQWMMSKIDKLSDKEIKENLLERSSWHHTGAMMNPTAYYGLAPTKYIFDYLREKFAK